MAFPSAPHQTLKGVDKCICNLRLLSLLSTTTTNSLGFLSGSQFSVSNEFRPRRGNRVQSPLFWYYFKAFKMFTKEFSLRQQQFCFCVYMGNGRPVLGHFQLFCIRTELSRNHPAPLEDERPARPDHAEFRGTTPRISATRDR